MLRAGEAALDDAAADLANMPTDRLVDLYGAWEFASGKEGAAGLATADYVRTKANADAFRAEVVRRLRETRAQPNTLPNSSGESR